MTLTPEGERLIAEVRTLLDTVDSLTEHRRRRRTTDEKLLTLGVLGSALAERWPDLTAAVHGQEPGITFSYAELDLADQYEAVRSLRVDVGIVQYVGPVDGLVFEHALTMPRVVVVPARSPLADADRLTEADLSDSPWLPTALAHPALEAWSGPAADGSHNRGALRHPAAIPGAVATTGRTALHAEAAGRFYRTRTSGSSRSTDRPWRSPVATRATDDRHAVAAVRHATRLLGRVR